MSAGDLHGPIYTFIPTYVLRYVHTYVCCTTRDERARDTSRLANIHGVRYLRALIGDQSKQVNNKQQRKFGGINKTTYYYTFIKHETFEKRILNLIR